MINWTTAKPTLYFLLRFLVSYFVLVGIYNLYLNNYLPKGVHDPYTGFVADTSSAIHSLFGQECYSFNSNLKPVKSIWLEGIYVSRVNEGCNAVSVMIIFIAFMIAFFKGWRTTILYILGGIVFIKLCNLLRIVMLNNVVRYYPKYEAFAHDFIFPAIIYGSVVLLWIVWLRFFVFEPEKK